eukprot:SAG31_NODE_16909_length_690_cov_1.734349_2_plen_156_part_01
MRACQRAGCYGAIAACAVASARAMRAAIVLTYCRAATGAAGELVADFSSLMRGGRAPGSISVSLGVACLTTATLSLSIAAPTASTVRQRQQPPAPDFCSADACACPWADKQFQIPAAGGLGPVEGSYMPYPRQYVGYKLAQGQQPPVIDGSLDDAA